MQPKDDFAKTTKNASFRARVYRSLDENLITARYPVREPHDEDDFFVMVISNLLGTAYEVSIKLLDNDNSGILYQVTTAPLDGEGKTKIRNFKTEQEFFDKFNKWICKKFKQPNQHTQPSPK